MAKRRPPSSAPKERAPIEQPRTPARDPLRVAVTGSTGMLERALCARLIGRGDQVTVISREAALAEERIRGAYRYVGWNGINVGPWVSALDGIDALVHLAGSPWVAQERELTHAQFSRARVLTTRAVVDGLGGARHPPKVLLSASSAHFYGRYNRDDTAVDERHVLPGSDPTSRSIRDWEQAAAGAREHEIRTVYLRFGSVLAPHDGILPAMVGLFDRHLGGTLLPRAGWRPWVHLEDAVELILRAMEDSRVSGAFNVTSPAPVRSREFSRRLGEQVGRAPWVPMPRPLALRLVGPAAAVQLQPIRRVVPAKALELGYTFQYPELAAALTQLIVARGRQHVGSGEMSSQTTG